MMSQVVVPLVPMQETQGEFLAGQPRNQQNKKIPCVMTDQTPVYFPKVIPCVPACPCWCSGAIMPSPNGRGT